jgi:hypothetical protein
VCARLFFFIFFIFFLLIYFLLLSCCRYCCYLRLAEIKIKKIFKNIFSFLKHYCDFQVFHKLLFFFLFEFFTIFLFGLFYFFKTIHIFMNLYIIYSIIDYSSNCRETRSVSLSNCIRSLFLEKVYIIKINIFINISLNFLNIFL